ncbi:MAG: response regulator [Candidatus Omnitrophota bacterium]|nr:MAG: response regulator [Candidatus Omnitrophota bacterium]
MFKLKILVVDDDPDIRDLITLTLGKDYTVLEAENGTQALEKTKKEKPDILILDYSLPDIDGTEICKTLRKNRHFLHTPILMLTGKTEVDDKVKGLEAGIDDYMIKPFAPQELVARIKMLLRRANIHLDANPLTRLPGNTTINRFLEEKIKTSEQFAVLYIDLDNFKALNDYYGFERGDRLIKNTAHLLIECVHTKGTPTDLVGHIGGDDFVILTSVETAEGLAKEIIAKFDAIAPQFFDEAERATGYIETNGRDGLVHKFGFPTISIGIITNKEQKFNHLAQVSGRGAEVKNLAKKFPQSKYILDRRTA